MPVRYVSGDPSLTQAEMLAVGYNARGRTEMDAASIRLMQIHAVGYATYTRLARQGRQKAGSLYLWQDAKPRLLFMTIRDSSVGATRLRYVQSACLTIARDYPLYAITNLAIAPIGNSYEWQEIKEVIDLWLSPCRVPIVVYEQYLEGVQADEGW